MGVFGVEVIENRSVFVDDLAVVSALEFFHAADPVGMSTSPLEPPESRFDLRRLRRLTGGWRTRMSAPTGGGQCPPCPGGQECPPSYDCRAGEMARGLMGCSVPARRRAMLVRCL